MTSNWCLVVVSCVGCSFELPANVDASGSLVVDALVVDAPPDARQPFNPPCLDDPSYTTGPMGTRYKIPGPGGNTRDSGVDRCAQDGAHLAVIETAAENAYLAAFADAEGAWIGLDDLDIENTFTWVTGSTAAFRGFVSPDPNDNGVEDCVYIRAGGSWNDTNCNDSRRPLCECDAAYEPPPRPACRMGPGATVINGRRMFLSTQRLSWTAARDACASNGSHLVVISDDEENTAINNAFSEDVWIGYSDAAAEGTFTWVNGSQAPFHKFPGGTPPANETEDCVVLTNNAGGTWDDRPCAEEHLFACECDPLYQ